MKPFIYFATIREVIDGDTIDVDIDMGFGVWKKDERIRLMGIDTPEKRTRDLLEKQFGLLATSIVEGFCPVGQKVLVETVLDSKGKFGRVLGNFWLPDEDFMNLNEYLLDNRYAVKYEGQSKELIKEQHIENYRYLVENGKVILNEGLTLPPL